MARFVYGIMHILTYQTKGGTQTCSSKSEKMCSRSNVIVQFKEA